ncbi:hypothetical protein D3C75_775360 [compost metagenome]
MRVNLCLQHFELGIPFALLLQPDLINQPFQLTYHLVNGFGQPAHFIRGRFGG